MKLKITLLNHRIIGIKDDKSSDVWGIRLQSIRIQSTALVWIWYATWLSSNLLHWNSLTILLPEVDFSLSQVVFFIMGKHLIVKHLIYDHLTRLFFFFLTMERDVNVLTAVTIIYWHHILIVLNCLIGEGNGNPLQYFCLGNPRDGGAWWAAVYGVAQSQIYTTFWWYLMSLHNTL